jgi:hypothetical protein
MSLITPRIFISSSDSCVPSDYCKSYGCSTVLGNVFGGTSLIIMVGVIIDTIQQINSYLLNKHYDGFNEGSENRKAVASYGKTISNRTRRIIIEALSEYFMFRVELENGHINNCSYIWKNAYALHQY